MAAEFNNDGPLDLATAMSVSFYDGTGSGRLNVWLGNGEGTFQSPTYVPSMLSLAVAAGTSTTMVKATSWAARMPGISVTEMSR